MLVDLVLHDGPVLTNGAYIWLLLVSSRRKVSKLDEAVLVPWAPVDCEMELAWTWEVSESHTGTHAFVAVHGPSVPTVHSADAS